MKFQVCLLLLLVALSAGAELARTRRGAFYYSLPYYGVSSPYYYAQPVAYASRVVGVPGFAASYYAPAYVYGK